MPDWSFLAIFFPMFSVKAKQCLFATATRNPYNDGKRALKKLYFLENIDCEYTFDPPHCGGSNEYPESMS